MASQVCEDFSGVMKHMKPRGGKTIRRPQVGLANVLKHAILEKRHEYEAAQAYAGSIPKSAELTDDCFRCSAKTGSMSFA